MTETPLLVRLRARIREEGPITVGEYMQACLADPHHGYYMRRAPFGAEGDFTTAPEICQIFGEMLGAWAAHGWWQLGQPARCALVELGPGRGTLMRDALRATKSVPGFHAAISIHLIETSARLRDSQRHNLANCHRPCFWHDDISSLPAMPAIVLANEFFDALPIEQEMERGLLRRVGLDGAGHLRFEPEGAVCRETSPMGLATMRDLAAHLRRHQGTALLVDYGYARPERKKDLAADCVDTLQAVRDHVYAPVLECPGEADLTAHVDFGALRTVAEKTGVQVYGPMSQGMLLDRLGGEMRLAHLLAKATEAQAQQLVSGWRRLTSPNEMGHLFKALALAPASWTHIAGFDTQPAAFEY